MHERDDGRRGARGGADERETRGQESPRAEGCVLLVLPSSFEEGLGLIAQRPPLAVGGDPAPGGLYRPLDTGVGH